jgi:DNA-binding transcriptional LysR family regulator
MRINDFTTLLVFKNIYEKKNMTVVAGMMNLSKPAISKRLDQLESELGFKLFTRTTRSITPTNEAHKFIDKINDIFDKVNNLNASLDESKTTRKRRIKISCIASMSQKFVGRILKNYKDKNPDIEIELIVTDSVLDPIEHNIDLMIRTNPNNHSNLIGRKLGNYDLVLVATPGYLKRHRRIKNIDDLVEHELLMIDRHIPIFNRSNKKITNTLLQQREFITNDSPLIYQLIMSGHGIGVRSSWDVKGEIENKKLQFVLPKKMFHSRGEVWILSSNDCLQRQPVRNLFEHLVKELTPYFEPES